MATPELEISGISNLTALLARLPLGDDTRALLQRLGVWNTRAHDGAVSRMKPFVTNVSSLTDDALSDTFSHWSAELMRLHELQGLLGGQRKLLELSAKKERAAARSRIRDEYEGRVQAEREKENPEKIAKPTAGEINDRAEEDPAVIKADESLVMLDVVLEGVLAYREGCVTAVSSLSREISFRQAQFGARLRA